MLTLEASATGAGVRPLEPPYTCREMSPADTEALGALYFASYPPGVACDTLDEAVADMRATFAGEYGELWHPGSAVVSLAGQLVAAVMTVHRAPWPDMPDCPFIIELFTEPAHQRRGLGRSMVERVLAAAAGTDRPRVALRVAPDNTAAVALYTSLGFVPA